MRAVGVLVALTAAMLVLMPVRRGPAGDADGNRERDQPDAAEAYALAKRQPTGRTADTGLLYSAALARRGGMPRYASRIGRTLPFAIPEARVWSGRDPRGLSTALDAAQTIGVLDAWTPLGPG